MSAVDAQILRKIVGFDETLPKERAQLYCGRALIRFLFNRIGSAGRLEYAPPKLEPLLIPSAVLPFPPSRAKILLNLAALHQKTRCDHASRFTHHLSRIKQLMGTLNPNILSPELTKTLNAAAARTKTRDQGSSLRVICAVVMLGESDGNRYMASGCADRRGGHAGCRRLCRRSQAIGCVGSALPISGRLPGRSCRRCARFRSWRLPAGFRRAAGWPRSRFDLPGIHQRGKFGQDFADRRRCRNHGPSHAVCGGSFRRRRLNERDEDATRFQHTPGALLRFAAHRVKHRIHIMHGVSKGAAE